MSIYEFMNDLIIHLIQVLNFLQTPAQHLPAYFILCPLKKGFVWSDHLLGNNVKARLYPGFRGKATKLDITHVVHGAPCRELPSHIIELFPFFPLPSLSASSNMIIGCSPSTSMAICCLLAFSSLKKSDLQLARGLKGDR